MNALQAMHESIDLAFSRRESGDDQDDPCSNAHFADMVGRVEDAIKSGDPFSEGKLNRWLGYIQGVIVALKLATLDEVKEINKRNA